MTDDNEVAWAATPEDLEETAEQTIENLRRELGSTRHRLTQLQGEVDSAQGIVAEATRVRSDQAVRVMELEGELRGSEQARERLVDDIRQICSDLLDEAERREWCDEYERFAEAVNHRLSQKWLKLPEREHTYRYIVSITLNHRLCDEDQVREDIQGSLEGVGENITPSYNELSVDVERQR